MFYQLLIDQVIATVVASKQLKCTGLKTSHNFGEMCGFNLLWHCKTTAQVLHKNNYMHVYRAKIRHLKNAGKEIGLEVGKSET